MDIEAGPHLLFPIPRRKRSRLVTALFFLWLLIGPAAGAQPSPGTEALLGIAIFPGAELIAMEGPSPELVDLQRPGWEFVAADITAADFLVDAPISEIRRFYRPICTRDRKLLMVRKDGPAGEIVSVHYTARHPLHPGKRWLRIVAYRLQTAAPEDPAHREGE